MKDEEKRGRTIGDFLSEVWTDIVGLLIFLAVGYVWWRWL